MKKSKLNFTHLEKVFWPKDGYTKGDVLAYYDLISSYILPYIKGRPMVMNRHPNGIEGQNFFHKDSSDLHLPDFVDTVQIYSESKNKKDRYILVNNKETLLYLVNLGCIELNPFASRAKKPHHPDFLIMDLDPSGNTFDEVGEVARGFKEILEGIGIKKSFPKTSGKRGMHIYVPLSGKFRYDFVRDIAKLLAGALYKKFPRIVSLEHFPNKRKGKIHPDFMRNSLGQTAACAYSLRPFHGATVSTPLEWKEVKKGLTPAAFTIKTIHSRLKKKGDLWKGVLGAGVDLKKALPRLEKYL